MTRWAACMGGLLGFVVSACGDTVVEPGSPTPVASPVNTQAAAEVPTVLAPPAVPEQGFRYDPEGHRDPFRPPVVVVQSVDTEATHPLQLVEVSKLKVVGILWGEMGAMAIVQTPDGRTYPVRAGAAVGSRRGVISRITERTVVVSEPVTESDGGRTTKRTVLELHSKEGGL